MGDSALNFSPFYSTPYSGTDPNDPFANTTLLTAPPGSSPGIGNIAAFGKSAQTLGFASSVLSGVGGAINSFYAAKSAQYQDRSQASSMAYQSSMQSLRAARDEINAQAILETGKAQVGAYTMQAGQQKAQATASMAARGIALGVGSAASVSASMDVEKDLNVLAINSNAVRRAWGSRMQEAAAQGQSTIDRSEATNFQAYASGIHPGLMMGSTLLTAAGRTAGQWNMNQWLKLQIANGLPLSQFDFPGGQ